jgi:hypothetical protein
MGRIATGIDWPPAIAVAAPTPRFNPPPKPSTLSSHRAHHLGRAVLETSRPRRPGAQVKGKTNATLPQKGSGKGPVLTGPRRALRPSRAQAQPVGNRPKFAAPSCARNYSAAIKHTPRRSSKGVEYLRVSAGDTWRILARHPQQRRRRRRGGVRFGSPRGGAALRKKSSARRTSPPPRRSPEW